MHFPKLNADQLAALERFAAAFGRKWKSQLTETYWFHARVWTGGQPGDGNLLHGLRNSHGPAWLYRFKLPR